MPRVLVRHLDVNRDSTGLRIRQDLGLNTGGRKKILDAAATDIRTDFNWYAPCRTDTIVRDIQNSVPYVTKNRCENER